MVDSNGQLLSLFLKPSCPSQLAAQLWSTDPLSGNIPFLKYTPPSVTSMDDKQTKSVDGKDDVVCLTRDMSSDAERPVDIIPDVKSANHDAAGGDSDEREGTLWENIQRNRPACLWALVSFTWAESGLSVPEPPCLTPQSPFLPVHLLVPRHGRIRPGRHQQLLRPG